MFGLSFITEAWIETFLYILLRFAGMIIVSPIFGRKNLPAIFRIGLCAMLSIIVIMLLPPSSYTRTTNLFGFFTNAVMETVLGMLIGYLSLIGLSIAIAAGQIIDMQIGFGMANFFGFLFSPKLLAMKFDKLNPLAGMKRMFSVKSIFQMAKSVLKMILMGVVVYFEFKRSFTHIPNLISNEIGQAASSVWSTMMAILWKSGLLFLLLGVLDYIYNWWEHEKNLKMSKEDIKQEYKQLEGDPKVKAKIKELQRQMGMRRMMQKVATADVVITNPTHFAIALKYDETISSAPVVVAKGQDLVALRIKEEAIKGNVQIVEKTTDIDQAIPEEFYQAVAQILAMIYRTKIRG